MHRTEISFIGGEYAGASSNINAQVCQNLYPVVDNEGGKTVIALRNTPGMKLWLDTGVSGECRGYLHWNGHLYVVVGSLLIQIKLGKVATTVGTIGTTQGKVWMAGGIDHLCLVDGSKGYYQLVTDTSLTEITDSDFPTPTSITYLNGKFIVTEKDSDSFYISDIEDASSWYGLNFLSAEDTPDNALAIVNHRRELHILGTDTKEVYIDTGNSAYPYTRVPGSAIQVGAACAESIASGADGLFWLDDQYRPRMAEGYEAVRIAPEQIEHQIQQYDVKTDAIGYIYSQEGHSFYALTFPDASKTWVFDITTGLWHTRAYHMTEQRHRAQWATWFDGKVLCGDFTDGNIYEFDLSTYTDMGDPIRRVRTAQSTHKGRDLVSFSSLEIEFEAGVGLVSGQGSDPQAILDWSDDGGHTWGNEHWADIGKIGKYGARAVWRRLGTSRSRIFRLTVTDPVKVIIIGAHLEAA